MLNIDSNLYTQEYKRFYFRDIQAITIRGTNLRAIWNGVLTILLLTTLGGSAALWPSRSDFGAIVGLVVLLTFGGYFAIVLAGNNLLGPTCSVYIRTAVQTEESPSLGRIRRAHKVLDRVRPLIVAAQGQVGREELDARLRELDESFVASAMTAAPVGSGNASGPAEAASLADEPADVPTSPPQPSAEPR